MLQRPKPSDSEADLLKEQERFLVSGAPLAAKVIRRPDKRRGGGDGGGGGGGGECQRDIVTIEDLPDDMPSLTPAPSKKSCSKENRVRFEDQDTEEVLDKHDTHISAVLSRIVVSIYCTASLVVHARVKKIHKLNSLVISSILSCGRRSIFARQIAAEKLKEASGPSGRAARGPSPPVETTLREASGPRLPSGPRLLSGEGLGGPDRSAETLRIHQENQAMLQTMSRGEILEEQRKLLAQLVLGPLMVSLGAMLRASILTPEALPPSSEEDLPLKPEKQWVHMGKLEPDKLEWTRDLPGPRRKGTQKAMQARFDFAGSLISPHEDLPTHLGLHHHGEEPELAGYSLQELFLLSRSQVIQQRSLSLNTLASILTKARAGQFASALSGSVMTTLLDAGLLFLLRFALDDNVEGVMAAAAHAIRALLVSDQDEAFLDHSFSWPGGLASFPLLPCSTEEQEEEEEEEQGLPENMRLSAKEKEERRNDHDVARHDVVKGLLRTGLLSRLRYILEVVRPSPRVVQDLLAVLTRISRHSSHAATQVLDCPRLMDVVMSEFLPTSWSAPSLHPPPSVYGLPLAGALKLLRVLATSGRHACARLLSSLGVRERLSRLLSPEPGELLLESGQALRVSAEAFRLWAVAASYGQACDTYIELYSVLLRALQAVTRDLDSSGPLLAPQRQRVQALLALLTQVTHSAGCHQELHAAMLRSAGRGDAAERRGGVGVCVVRLYLRSSLPPHCPVRPLLHDSSSLLPFPRSCSAVCDLQGHGPGPEAVPSLPGLASAGWKDGPGLAVPSSPFPLLTALCVLLDSITGIHKGLSSKPVIGYLGSCCRATPNLSNASAWVLRHEHHLLYLLVRLAHRVAPKDPAVARHASLYHQVAMALLPWLLPGSEHLAHDLLCSVVFSKDFLPESHSGGPEALELAELKLHAGAPHLQAVGPLLREACVQLPSLRGCYLGHLAHLEPSVLGSKDAYLGRTPWVRSRLLPELGPGPALPADWPYLPLVTLYERTGGGELQVEELPRGALQAVTHCLQWLLLLEVWREGALKAVTPVAKLARLSCVFLSASDLFLERPVQRLLWALLRLLTRPDRLDSLDLDVAPPGLASFQDLFSALLVQYEAVSFGDPLFGCWLLLPLQRRYSAAMKLAVFGEHVGALRSLACSGLPLVPPQLSLPLERYTSPPEASLPLLQLYFRSLVTGGLLQARCPLLYTVALAHLNAFLFSEGPAQQVSPVAQRVRVKGLIDHLLLFRGPQQDSALGFHTYQQLPPDRAQRLERALGTPDSSHGGTH
uniref:RNA polymerase II associated protein 1 n=1 Tax=Gadus morhua TaxID=8049 RepID=A0A8C5AEC1_GADMO